MSNIGVNPVMVFMNRASQPIASGQKEQGIESFDETFNSLKNDRTKSNESFSDTKKTISENDQSESDVKKFDTSVKKNSIKKDEKLSEEQIASVSDTVVAQLKEAIQEKFGITGEELAQTMEEIGISDENLLDISGITKLVMNLDGIEKQADILTNPDFATDVKEILAKLDDIKSDVYSKIPGEQEIQPEEIIQTADTKGEAVTGNSALEETSETVQESETDKEDVYVSTETTDELSEEVKENQTTTGNSESESEGLLKHDDSAKQNHEADKIDGIQNVQPQDFAARLTEDLSAKVGEKQATEIVRQVVEQIQMQSKPGMTSMEMQLYPEHLGKVLIQVVSREGSITAQITAESEAAKNALETQLTLLKENLNNQGLKIENVEVTIASHAFEQNMQGEGHDEQNAGRGNRGRRAARLLNEELQQGLPEETDSLVMEFRGNTVSYSA